MKVRKPKGVTRQIKPKVLIKDDTTVVSTLIDSSDEDFEKYLESVNMTGLVSARQILFTSYNTACKVKDELIEKTRDKKVEDEEKALATVNEFHILLLRIDRRYKRVKAIISERNKSVEEATNAVYEEMNKVGNDT